ncbi:glycosyl hydrolase [Microbacterium marinilacus]|nr:glycosyl hydrolase [Microbacterium marinilacus]MBY0690185.1 hypothetical protein [Microbacterium marinilacus]
MSDDRKWWKAPFTRAWWTRRRAVIASVCVALLVIGGGTAVAIALNSGEEPAPPVAETPTPSASSASPTPTPTPTPEPEGGELPRAAVARGEIASWNVAGDTELGGVRPQVGGASDGQTSLVIDAPAVGEPTVAAYTPLTVEPETEYTLTFDVRLLDEEVSEVPVELAAGDTVVPMPDLGSEWWTIEETVTTGAGQTGIDLKLTVTDAVRGFGIDNISMTAEGGENVVPNSSFEDVSSEWGITNDSLILNEQMATLAAAVAPGEANWVATRLDGSEAARGTATIGDRVSPIPLEGLGQGYYTVSVTDANGAVVNAPVGIVRMPDAFLAGDDRIGAHIHPTKAINLDAVSAASSLGMGSLRFNFTWKNVEKQSGVYNWGETYPRAAAQSAVRGVGVLGIVGWGNPVYGDEQVPRTQEALAAYGRYAAAVAQNFDLIGLEVFNEFNIETFNRGCRTGSCYLPLIQSVYGPVKEVAPDLPVIGGVTGNYEAAFFDQLWQGGGLQYVDAMSFHPYQVYNTPENLAGVMRDARASMDANGGAKPIWITELGWTTKTGDVSLEEQGNRLVRAQITALATGVEHYFWYDLINDETDRAEHEGNFGLFSQAQNGLAALPPKPAAFVQALLVAQLDGRAYDKTDEVEGVRSRSFGEAGDTMKVVYPTGDARTVDFPAWDTVTVTDLSGNVTEVEPSGGTVSIDIDRILLLGGGIGEEGDDTAGAGDDTADDAGSGTESGTGTDEGSDTRSGTDARTEDDEEE